jgi:MFS family permease
MFQGDTFACLDPADASNQGALYLGAAFFLYAFGQFLGSTVLGSLSDRKGRKRTLLCAITGSLLSYLLSSFAVLSGNLLLFLTARWLNGFFEGSTGIAQAYVSDRSKSAERVSALSKINVAASLGWLLGPLLGSFLAAHPLPHISPYASVFFCSSLITASLLIAAYCFLDEQEGSKEVGNVWQSYAEVKKDLASSSLRPLLAVNMTAVMAFACFQQFFPLYLLQHFGYGEREVSYSYTYLSLVWILAQKLWITPMAKRWDPAKGCSIYCSLLTLGYLGLMSTESPSFVFALIPLISVGAAGALTHAVGILSLACPDESQGAILGINRSAHAVGRGLPSLFAGYLAVVHCNLPILCGAIFALSTVLLLRWTGTESTEAPSPIHAGQ